MDTKQIKIDIISQYNQMANSLYKQYGKDIESSKIRLLIMEAIVEHVVAKTSEVLERKDYSISKKLDKILYKIDTNHDFLSMGEDLDTIKQVEKMAENHV